VTTAADNPIRSSEADLLGRSKAATSFAKQVLSLDASEGVVVGVLGPWGSGKTSFINLARAHFESAEVPVVDFNPWMFSGAEQLVESFFSELSAQLRIRERFSNIASELEEYGAALSALGWLPLVGPWIERGRILTRAVARLLLRKKSGIVGKKEKVEKALGSLKKPIVVVLDDIDRLTTAEIRDTFRLVRLTASFPNIIYILAFDRFRVEKALCDEGIPGRDYLEKILQVGIDLPSIPENVLRTQVFTAIDQAISGIEEPGPFDTNAWPDTFVEIIWPLLRNLRDVRRYAASVHGTVEGLGGRVALVDVLALEAIRVFLPSVFQQLPTSVEGLTATSELGFGGGSEPSEHKQQIDRLLEGAGKQGDVIRGLIARLFPAAERHLGGTHYGGEWKNRWLRDRRVAHKDVLRLYLERVIGEGLQAFIHAEQAWDRMTNRSALEEYLSSLDQSKLEEVIASLEAYENEFSSEHVEPASVVLLNILPKLPERQRGTFEFDSRMVVGRVVYRLVRSLKDPGRAEEVVEKVLPQLTTLFAKLELITTVGHHEGAGHKLVSKDAAIRFEKAWREALRSADAGVLASEHDLLRMLLLYSENADPSEPQVAVPDAPEVTRALIESARWEVRSQPIDSRAVKRRSRLAWDSLVKVFGDESILRERLERLKETEPRGLDELLQLVDRYLDGWRPGRDE
jgi:predicted KAP-like P-loop ATPase